MGWIDDEGQIGSLAPLRDDILRGDLRALYLIWLASAARSAGVGAKADDWDDVEGQDLGEEDEIDRMIR